MSTMRIKWTSRGTAPEGFIPPTRFWDEKDAKKYHSPKRNADGTLECLINDNIKNREYIEAAKTWDIIEEDVVVRRQKVNPPPTEKPKKSRTQMQSEMDEAGFNYGDGAVISDKKMKEQYRASAPKRSKHGKKKRELEEKIRNGEIVDTPTIKAREKKAQEVEV